VVLIGVAAWSTRTNQIKGRPQPTRNAS
jgi:hypothetical protein